MKRIFGILVSAAVLISMAFFVSCEANSEPTNENTSQETDSTGSNSGSNDETETKGRIILHAQYQYIYVWESGSQFDNKQNEMEAEGNGWYRFEIESSSAMVIFKPNADDWNGKTDDLSATTGEWWYDNGSLHSSKPNSGGSSDGNGGSEGQTAKIILHAQYPYIYIWESGSQFDTKQSEMDTEDNGWYRFEIESSSAMVIFKPNADDWNGKTDDLSATTGEWWYDDGSLHSYKPESDNSSGGSSDENNESSDNNSGSGEQTDTQLSAPTGLIATTQSSSEIILSWNAVSGATLYDVYYGTNSSNASANLYTSSTSTRCTVSSLSANTSYYFWVKACSSDGTESDFSSYAYAMTKTTSSSSNGTGGSSTVTNDFLSNMTISTTFTQPGIAIRKIELTDGKNGFYIPLSNSSKMNAEYYILYRSTTSKTDRSAYKKIKTVSRSSNIAFEDFDIDFTKNKTYYYIVVATSSKNDTYGTISINGLSVALGDTQIKYNTTANNAAKTIYRYVSVDDGNFKTLTYTKGTSKSRTISLEPGYHSIKWCSTSDGSYVQIVPNYNFLPGCEYSITLETGNISSSSPTLLSESISAFDTL